MTDIKIFENISAVTFNNIPFDSGALADILTGIAGAGISIDMISQSPPMSDKLKFAFTFADDDMTKLLTVINPIKERYKSTPVISSGNSKLIIKSDVMTEQAGYAADIFAKLYKAGVNAFMITTGVDEISILVRGSDGEAAYCQLTIDN